MPYVPKDDAPESIWLDLVESLQAFFTVDDAEWQFYFNVLAAFHSPRFIPVQELATHGDYTCDPPTLADYVSGAYVDMLWNYAYQRALVLYCEDE